MPGGKILRRSQRHLRKTYSTASSFQLEETDTDALVEEEEHLGGDSEATADSDATEPYDDRDDNDDDELFVL